MSFIDKIKAIFAGEQTTTPENTDQTPDQTVESKESTKEAEATAPQTETQPTDTPVVAIDNTTTDATESNEGSEKETQKKAETA